MEKLLEQQKLLDAKVHLSSELTTEFYPEILFEHPIFKHQINLRNELFSTITNLYTKVPDSKMNLTEAYQLELINEDLLSSLYSQLIDFLDADLNNSRIILYLPNSFLLSDLQIFSPDFQMIYKRFIQIYKDAWIYLLTESEVRASYTNGDVLEPGMQSPERIRKAAHLLPFLIEKSILTENEFLLMIFESEDEELLQSLLEGFLASHYVGLVSQDSLDKLINESNRKIVLKVALDKIKIEEGDNQKLYVELHEIPQLIETELQQFRAAQQSETYSEARKQWLVNEFRTKLIEKYASALSNKFESDSEINDELIIEVLLRSIFIRSEQNYEMKIDEFEFIKKHLNSRFQQIIKSGLIRLFKLKVIDKSVLEHFQIQDVDLSITQHQLDQNILNRFNKAIVQIQNDPILSANVFPQILLFGSKVKGYASLSSDVDIALFFRPEAEFADRAELHTRLRQIPELENIDKILEFWIDSDDQGYKFRNVEIKAPTIVGAPEIHILFNGIWLGNQDARNLRDQIILRYLNLQNFGKQKETVRSHLLRQLEMDTLQFRLMHKGFGMFYPQTKLTNSFPKNLIDWESSFWDEGFRRVATLLFLNKVFLPNVDLIEQ